MKLIVGILFLTATSLLFGASESVKKNELFVFSGVSVLGKDARYENRFVPFSVAIGDGVQIINLDDESRPVWGLGLTHHFSQRWGIQAIVQYQKRDLTSNSNEASVQYEYVSWSPEYPGPTIHVDNTIESPELPRAQYRDLGFMLNAVYRVLVWRVHLEATGGLVFHQISEGSFENLYFQNSVMISRGIIMNSSALLHTKWEDTTQVGANIGLRATFPLTSRFALFVEGRYLCFEDKSIKQLWNGFEEIQFSNNANTREEIEPLVTLRDFELNPSMASVTTGLIFSF